MAQSPFHLTKITWPHAQNKLMKANPELTALLNALPENEKKSVYLASYPFGTKLIKNSILQLPNEQGELVDFTDPSIAQEIREDFSYSPLPFGVWLNTCAEVFMETSKRTSPVHMFSPGHWFGFWEWLDQKTMPALATRPWNVTAGCRTLFTLPKITNLSGLAKLSMKYGLPMTYPPKTLKDHQPFLKSIADSPLKKKEWRTEILIFTKEWFTTPPESDHAYLTFHYMMLKKEWEGSVFARNKAIFDLLRHVLANAQKLKNLKPTKILSETTANILAISMGLNPGLSPIKPKDNRYGPISFLQDALEEGYELKRYFPTFMAPAHLDPNQPDRYLYYSLQYPTFFTTIPRTQRPHSVLDDLRMVKRLIEETKLLLQERHPTLYDAIKGLHFRFYHYEPDDFYGILPSNDILKTDKNMIPANTALQFCETSTFLKGCVQIGFQ